MTKRAPASPKAFLDLLARVKRKLEPRLESVLEQSATRGANYGPEVSAMVESVASLCERGGKRLRPGLCVVGALAAGGERDAPEVIEAGVVLELLQAYFLIHDDWMDQDSERRGGATAHVTLAREFKDTHLGACSAILAGDHSLALASAHLARLPTTPARLRRCLEEFAEMQVAAVAGQQRDVIARSEPELTYVLKTASYTVRGPLRLGAHLAGGSKATLSALDAYARPTGVAFQLRDDLIGVFEDSSVTGKPRGADLRAGKNTALVVEARRRLGARELRDLDSVFGNARATQRRLDKVVRSLEECGARAAVETSIGTLTAEALGALKSDALTPTSRRLLGSALSALTNRRA